MTWDSRDSTDVESHICQVKAYFVVKDVTVERKKVACLHLSLKGEPKNFFTQLQGDQCDTFEHAAQALVDRFKSGKTVSQYQQELSQRRQIGGESAQELKFAILDLVSRAYPQVKDDAARQALAIAHFRSALSSNISTKLAWVTGEETGLDDLVKRAAQIERDCAAVRVVGSDATSESSSELLKKLEELSTSQAALTATVAAIQSQQQQGHTIRGRQRTCFICDLPGHFARDCRRNQQGRGRGLNNRQPGRCYRCQLQGHRAAECTAPSPVPSNQGN
jgi:hypothetical protein